jgi:hypothetical protein
MSTAFRPYHDYFRQYLTFEGNGAWDGTEFVVNPTSGTFDGIVVLQSDPPLDATYRLRCPMGQTLLVVQEPPYKLQLPPGYLRQFSRQLKYPALHWFVEIPLEEVLTRQEWPKSKLISAVISNKQLTSGQRRRYRLMTELKNHFGDRLDWFGRGVKDLDPHSTVGAAKFNYQNKGTGLLDYRYHIVLENGSCPHYWTEKLADAFVANCLPFYWGAPNISDYFEPSSIRRIDVDDPARTIRVIEEALENDEYSRAQGALARARRRLVTEYHPYASFMRAFDGSRRGHVTEVEIRPFRDFRPSLKAWMRTKLKGIGRRILARRLTP